MDEQLTVRKSDVVNAFIMVMINDPEDVVEDVRQYAEDAANYFFELLKEKT